MVSQHWNACAPLRHLSLVKENTLGAGLVTHRRTLQVSWREVGFTMIPKSLGKTRMVGHLLP